MTISEFVLDISRGHTFFGIFDHLPMLCHFQSVFNYLFLRSQYLLIEITNSSRLISKVDISLTPLPLWMSTWFVYDPVLKMIQIDNGIFFY